MVNTGVQGVSSDPRPALLNKLLPPEEQEINISIQLPSTFTLKAVCI